MPGLGARWCPAVPCPGARWPGPCRASVPVCPGRAVPGCPVARAVPCLGARWPGPCRALVPVGAARAVPWCPRCPLVRPVRCLGAHGARPWRALVPGRHVHSVPIGPRRGLKAQRWFHWLAGPCHVHWCPLLRFAGSTILPRHGPWCTVGTRTPCPRGLVEVSVHNDGAWARASAPQRCFRHGPWCAHFKTMVPFRVLICSIVATINARVPLARH